MASGIAAAEAGAGLRGVLVGNTVAMMAGLGLAFACALMIFVDGNAAPLFAAVAALAFMVLSAVLVGRNASEAAIATHVAALAIAGSGLALMDGAVINFGVGLGVLAGVYGVALGRSRVRMFAWGAPAMVVAVSGFGNWASIALGGWPASVFPVIAIAVVAAMTLITFRHLDAARQQLATDQTQVFATLADTMLGAVVRYRENGTPTYISRSASQLLGCRPFELDHTGLFERVHVMDRPAYRKAIADVSRNRVPFVVELRLRRDDAQAGAGGRYIWTELSLAPLSLPTGSDDQPCEVLGVMRNISVRKDGESQLEAARQEAVDASEAKSRFLATIGHELRTPLNAIVGFSDMMAEGIGGDLSPTHQEYAGHISRSGHHLIDVVNMLLDMSKIEAGKFEVHTELFAPQDLVEPCLQMVEKLGRDRRIDIDARLPERLPNIVGDERACRQILINLLSNALKFSHEGGKVILSVKRQGKMLNISVSDGGIGMHPDTIRRIGEPFLQAQAGLARRYEGTGLGLSIVKGLVALHGGRLEVLSEQGVGTTVTVLLPIDGPQSLAKVGGTIEHLPARMRKNDEEKWLEDERRSAAL
ncbi:MAG TPA: PAS domain-containing sensor histidine kinase [Pelagibacterium sp.]|nr:PAS domain-containing sensor histidine kinase [Pelagibacterium sp.]